MNDDGLWGCGELGDLFARIDIAVACFVCSETQLAPGVHDVVTYRVFPFSLCVYVQPIYFHLRLST